MTRTVDEWVEIIGKADATNEDIARRVLADLTGYRFNSRNRNRDVEQLGNAMLAYVKLHQIHDVKVP